MPSYGNDEVDAAQLLRTMSIDIPLASLKAGRNTFQLRYDNWNYFQGAGNIDLSLVVP